MSNIYKIKLNFVKGSDWMKTLLAAFAIFSMLGLSACHHMGRRGDCGCAQSKGCADCKDAKGADTSAEKGTEKSGGCSDCKK
jgi:hypothetical protein